MTIMTPQRRITRNKSTWNVAQPSSLVAWLSKLFLAVLFYLANYLPTEHTLQCLQLLHWIKTCPQTLGRERAHSQRLKKNIVVLKFYGRLEHAYYPNWQLGHSRSEVHCATPGSPQKTFSHQNKSRPLNTHTPKKCLTCYLKCSPSLMASIQFWPDKSAVRAIWLWVLSTTLNS